MFKSFYLFLVLTSMLTLAISCGENNIASCNPKCQNWEKCENDKCILEENNCNNNNDCKDNFKCQIDAHQCVEDISRINKNHTNI